MAAFRRPSKRHKSVLSVLSIDEIEQKAKGIHAMQGAFLLAFDVIKSRAHSNRWRLQEELFKVCADLSTQFQHHLPRNTLATLVREETGFESILGDAAWAAVDSPRAARQIVEYTRMHYPHLALRWEVAADGWELLPFCCGQNRKPQKKKVQP